jgi:hypothetical protein
MLQQMLLNGSLVAVFGGSLALAGSPALAGEIGAAQVVKALSAYHRVPAYPNHVTEVDIQNRPTANSGGSYALQTTDSVATVSAWYKSHLPDESSATTTADGHHLFYTHNGSTVDVSKAPSFEGNYTVIGVIEAK